mmetsp:Transcript_19496/g.62060  ORF Transcript_19496/g.62060 Transcript_19496/m.62060 type:complete len:211 (+) Transcript_19496:360-992(+)
MELDPLHKVRSVYGLAEGVGPLRCPPVDLPREHAPQVPLPLPHHEKVLHAHLCRALPPPCGDVPRHEVWRPVLRGKGVLVHVQGRLPYPAAAEAIDCVPVRELRRIERIGRMRPPVRVRDEPLRLVVCYSLPHRLPGMLVRVVDKHAVKACVEHVLQPLAKLPRAQLSAVPFVQPHQQHRREEGLLSALPPIHPRHKWAAGRIVWAADQE